MNESRSCRIRSSHGPLRLLLSLLALAAPALGQRITEYPVPLVGGVSGQPYGITSNPAGGNLAFTLTSGNRIGFINVSGTFPSVVTIPTAASAPFFICTGPDGNLWFTEAGANKIGRLAAASPFPDGMGGTTGLKEYNVPTGSSFPYYITGATDGNVYFTELAAGKIGIVTYAGSVSETPTATVGGGASYVTGSPNGYVYYTEPDASGVGVLSSFLDTNEDFVAPSTEPTSVVLGLDGNVWSVLKTTNKVRRGAATLFSIPTASSDPARLINGPDGNLWFLELGPSKLARVTPAGVITEYQLPAIPSDMALGPDGNFWITSSSANKILKFRPFIQGDANGDGSVGVSDVLYMINFLFAGGPAPK